MGSAGHPTGFFTSDLTNYTQILIFGNLKSKQKQTKADRSNIDVPKLNFVVHKAALSKLDIQQIFYQQFNEFY